jgi:WD40 repeat protein
MTVKSTIEYSALTQALCNGTLELICTFIPKATPLSMFGEGDRVVIAESRLTLEEINLTTFEVTEIPVPEAEPSVEKISDCHGLPTYKVLPYIVQKSQPVNFEKFTPFSYKDQNFYVSKVSNTITIWDEKFTQFKNVVNCHRIVALGIFENMLVTFDTGGMLKHWDLEILDITNSFQQVPVEDNTITVFFCGDKMLCIDEGRVGAVATKTGLAFKTFESEWIKTTCLLAYESKILCQSRGKKIKLIDWETGQVQDIPQAAELTGGRVSLVYKRYLILGHTDLKRERTPQIIWTVQVWKF